LVQERTLPHTDFRPIDSAQGAWYSYAGLFGQLQLSIVLEVLAMFPMVCILASLLG
jgi:hypothetical protein